MQSLSTLFQWLYLNFFVPAIIVLISIVFIIYCTNMIRGVSEDNLPSEVKFRRGIASLFPFLLSLYLVIVSEKYEIPGLFIIPAYMLLISGMIIGFIFVLWINKLNKENELFSTLSCFCASLILFTILTSFVVTDSFNIISFIFGILFGVCVFIMGYGFSSLQEFKIEMPNNIKMKFRKNRQDDLSDIEGIQDDVNKTDL